MIRTKLFLACALAFVVSLAGTPTSAQEPTNQITYFTFSAPFELPGGQVLPAGKYVFKIVDSPGNRHIVQVMSEDQQTMHATLLAIPAQRQDPADEPEVRFMEVEANAAPAIRTWWYPGRSIGHEFIYPKDHARRLASRQSEGVLTVASDAAGEDVLKTADLTRIAKDGQETAVSVEATTERTAENTTQPSEAPTAAQSTTAQTTTQTSTITQPTPETSASATGTQSTPTPRTTPESTTPTSTPAESTAATTADGRERTTPSTTTAADTSARTELPRTASLLPLVGLIGVGSLIGAGLLRFRR